MNTANNSGTAAPLGILKAKCIYHITIWLIISRTAIHDLSSIDNAMKYVIIDKKNNTETRKCIQPYTSSKTPIKLRKMPMDMIKDPLILLHIYRFLKPTMIISIPPIARPRLNIGAAPLLTACPRSLSALFNILNHGDTEMANAIIINGKEKLRINIIASIHEHLFEDIIAFQPPQH